MHYMVLVVRLLLLRGLLLLEMRVVSGVTSNVNAAKSGMVRLMLWPLGAAFVRLERVL